jgi:hypothetical protein
MGRELEGTMSMLALLELNDGSVALIDREDIRRVAAYDWFVPDTSGERYVVGQRTFRRGGNETYVYLHRLIADASPDEIVAHLNGDTLDNRRDNLAVMKRDQPAPEEFVVPRVHAEQVLSACD